MNLFNFFKKNTNIKINMPFDISKIKYNEKYERAILEIIKQEDDLDALKIDNNLLIEFGDQNAIHIVYFSIVDLNILMEPEKDGWKATVVHVVRTEGQREMLEAKGFKFLFNIPNMLYGEKNHPEEDVFWSEMAAVMERP